MRIKTNLLEALPKRRSTLGVLASVRERFFVFEQKRVVPQRRKDAKVGYGIA
jgi:hypothetical protein